MLTRAAFSTCGREKSNLSVQFVGHHGSGSDFKRIASKSFSSSIGIRRSSTNFAASLSQAFLTDVLHLAVHRLKMSAV
jgi:hypothetical protein